MSGFNLAGFAVVFGFCWFIPTMIAFSRRHPSRLAILFANIVGILFPWSWIPLVVWALSGGDPPNQRILMVTRDRIRPGRFSRRRRF